MINLDVSSMTSGNLIKSYNKRFCEKLRMFFLVVILLRIMKFEQEISIHSIDMHVA